MRTKGISALAISCFVLAHMFALTVELVDEYQAAPSPLLAQAARAPVSAPRLPQDFVRSPSGEIKPAVYPQGPKAVNALPSRDSQVREADFVPER